MLAKPYFTFYGRDSTNLAKASLMKFQIHLRLRALCWMRDIHLLPSPFRVALVTGSDVRIESGLAIHSFSCVSFNFTKRKIENEMLDF